MRGIGPVRIGKETVYTYFVTERRVAKPRLSPDECHKFDLFRGQQVQVGFDGRELTGALVTAVASTPPFVWVELELVATIISRAGLARAATMETPNQLAVG